jgi:hypothetical protein
VNKESDLQKILKSKYQEGPNVDIRNGIGINRFSGNFDSAYYELIGEKEIFRLLIMRPSRELFTSKYVGNHLLVLLIEEEELTTGGFVSLNEDLESELEKVFAHRSSCIPELIDLWEQFVQPHYLSLN